MSTAATPPAPSPLGAPPVVYARQPLGLPEGSVRALLTIMVLGMIGVILLLPTPRPVPIYLYYLAFLIVGHYFGSRGPAVQRATPGAPHPLYLPPGLLRGLIILAFAGVIGWGLYRNPEYLERLKPDTAELVGQPYLPVVILGVFFLGVVVNRLARAVLTGSDGRLPAWYQDMNAWVALVAVLLLTAEIVIQLVINPSLERPIKLPNWEGFLSAIVAFYFGVRC